MSISVGVRYEGLPTNEAGIPIAVSVVDADVVAGRARTTVNESLGRAYTRAVGELHDHLTSHGQTRGGSLRVRIVVECDADGPAEESGK